MATPPSLWIPWSDLCMGSPAGSVCDTGVTLLMRVTTKPRKLELILVCPVPHSSP